MIDVVLDLSHWQSEVDFAAVKAGGIAAVILKATQGMSWVDRAFVGRMCRANAAGLLVGAYHFCDGSKPAIQAEHFLRVAGSLPVLALDIEANALPGESASPVIAAEIAARVQIAKGRSPLVYIGRWGPSGTGAGLPNSVLSKCPLWLPEYGTDPVPPAGWAAWTLWQYTDAGTAAGVMGPVDRSRFAGTLDELTAWWSGQSIVL
jgi:lysozyme